MVAETGRARISVVIPAYNEGPTIAAVIARCRAHADEVLVVDDGSRDDTSERARAAGARVVRLAPNRGKGCALRRGIEEARGELLVFIDADGQDDPDEIPTLLAALAPSVDMVIGSRRYAAREGRATACVRRLGGRALCGALNLMFGARVTDPFAGFRAVRASALSRCAIRAQRYDIEVDVLLALLLTGSTVVEVPVRRRRGTQGASGLDSVVDGARILGRMVDRRLDFVRERLTPR